MFSFLVHTYVINEHAKQVDIGKEKKLNEKRKQDEFEVFLV